MDCNSSFASNALYSLFYPKWTVSFSVYNYCGLHFSWTHAWRPRRAFDKTSISTIKSDENNHWLCCHYFIDSSTLVLEFFFYSSFFYHLFFFSFWRIRSSTHKAQRNLPSNHLWSPFTKYLFILSCNRSVYDSRAYARS